MVPFVHGLGQLPAVRGSLRVKPRWLGPPPSSRVLLLFLHFLSRGHSFLLSSQSEPGDLVGSQKIITLPVSLDSR